MSLAGQLSHSLRVACRCTHSPACQLPRPLIDSACTLVMRSRFSVSDMLADSCASCECRCVWRQGASVGQNSCTARERGSASLGLGLLPAVAPWRRCRSSSPCSAGSGSASCLRFASSLWSHAARPSTTERRRERRFRRRRIKAHHIENRWRFGRRVAHARRCSSLRPPITCQSQTTLFLVQTLRSPATPPSFIISCSPPLLVPLVEASRHPLDKRRYHCFSPRSTSMPVSVSPTDYSSLRPSTNHLCSGREPVSLHAGLSLLPSRRLPLYTMHAV